MDSLFSISMILPLSCLKYSPLAMSAVLVGAPTSSTSPFFSLATLPGRLASSSLSCICILSSRASTSCTVSSLRSLFNTRFSSSFDLSIFLVFASSAILSLSAIASASVSPVSSDTHGKTFLRSCRVYPGGQETRARMLSTRMSLTSLSPQEKQMHSSLVPSGSSEMNSAMEAMVEANIIESRSASCNTSLRSSGVNAAPSVSRYASGEKLWPS
mmetsp:Transcript_13973/g.30866  ORF Transcript_13973/g.30866 Transcript_13973/m.30866 type:complete len:214 (-) Transcript_13973:1378-2019(-)